MSMVDYVNFVISQPPVSSEQAEAELKATKSILHKLDCKDAKADADDVKKQEGQRLRLALDTLTHEWAPAHSLPYPKNVYETLVGYGRAERKDDTYIQFRKA